MADKRKIELLRGQGVLNTDPYSVKEPFFKTGTFFDPHDLLQVKYEMIRQVEAGGRSVTEASEVFGFSRPSFYQAKNSFEDEGVMGLVPKKRGPRNRHKLTEEVINFVEMRLRQDKALKIEDISREIKEKFLVAIHPRSIRRALEDVKKTKNAGKIR